MRWFPEHAARGMVWRGDRLDYRAGDQSAHDAFRLERAGRGWRLCPLDDGLGHGPPCQPVFFSEANDVSTGDRFSLEAHGERLVFQFRTTDASLTVFEGVRDGCD